MNSVQNRVCKFLLTGEPAPGYVEEELHGLMQGRVLASNENALKVKHRHKVLKEDRVVSHVDIGSWRS